MGAVHTMVVDDILALERKNGTGRHHAPTLIKSFLVVLLKLPIGPVSPEAAGHRHGPIPVPSGPDVCQKWRVKHDVPNGAIRLLNVSGVSKRDTRQALINIKAQSGLLPSVPELSVSICQVAIKTVWRVKTDNRVDDV